MLATGIALQRLSGVRLRPEDYQVSKMVAKRWNLEEWLCRN